jgi:type IX secretion system PorP/SprF family membrane protein
MNKKILHIVILMTLYVNAIAQDPIYSQFYYNRLELNPAFCGGDGAGKLRLNSFHRNLYRPIKGPFNNSNISVDYGICGTNLGVGLIASNEMQGDGYLMINKIDGVIGIPLAVRNGIISFGVKYGYIFQNLDWNQYTFSDQYDPIRGNVRPSINSNINSDFSTSNNLTFGMNYTTWNWKKTKAYNVGFTYNNFNQPSVGYLNRYNLPQRLTFYAGAHLRKNPLVMSGAINMYGRFDIQKNFKTSIGVIEYYFNSKFNLGAGCRVSIYNQAGIGNTTSLILSSGIQTSTAFKMIFSYETNIGGLNVIGAGNTFELGCIWVPTNQICALKNLTNSFKGKSGKNAVNRISCPVFNRGKNGIIAPF